MPGCQLRAASYRPGEAGSRKPEAGSRKPEAGSRRQRSTIFAMGFNPFRPQRNTATDVVLVVSFAALTVVAVLWAFFG